MRPELIVCPNPECGASGRIGVHSRKKRQYICHACHKTFAETKGTMLYGLKYPTSTVLLVLSLLSHGCPIPAIVFSLGIDERTVTDWLRKAGKHAKQVHTELIQQTQLQLAQVQADELYTKIPSGSVWVANAISVFSRLWLGGEVSWNRDEKLVHSVLKQVRAASAPNSPMLWLVDGFRAYSQITKVFRDPLRRGTLGRPRLAVWEDLHIVQVVKHHLGKRLTNISRRLVHGERQRAEQLLEQSQTFVGTFNTAYIERFNGTLRTWMAALVRRTRTPSASREQLELALFWTGCVYNFCHRHASLDGSPAMAADITDHVWSIEELIRYRYRRE